MSHLRAQREWHTSRWQCFYAAGLHSAQFGSLAFRQPSPFRDEQVLEKRIVAKPMDGDRGERRRVYVLNMRDFLVRR